MQLKSPIKDLINEVIKQKKEGVIFNCRDYKSQMKDLIDEVIKHQQEGVILNCRDYWNLSSCLTLTKKTTLLIVVFPLLLVAVVMMMMHVLNILLLTFHITLKILVLKLKIYFNILMRIISMLLIQQQQNFA